MYKYTFYNTLKDNQIKSSTQPSQLIFYPGKVLIPSMEKNDEGYFQPKIYSCEGISWKDMHPAPDIIQVPEVYLSISLTLQMVEPKVITIRLIADKSGEIPYDILDDLIRDPNKLLELNDWGGTKGLWIQPSIISDIQYAWIYQVKGVREVLKGSE